MGKVALHIQHAQCMCHIILSSEACLALQHSSTLSDNGTMFEGGKKLLDTQCVF